MKKNIILVFLISIGVSLTPGFSWAQCKGMAKKCVPGLSPYIYTGQLNSTNLFAGESAELVMAFTGGQQYRIMACGQEGLGQLRIVIFNSKKQVVFNNKDYNFMQYWDLKVEATDDYTVQVTVPQPKNQTPGELAPNGCVAVLVGFKND